MTGSSTPLSPSLERSPARLGILLKMPGSQPIFNMIIDITNCSSTTDTLPYFRIISTAQLSAVLGSNVITDTQN